MNNSDGEGIQPRTYNPVLMLDEDRARLIAFQWLERQTRLIGETIPRSILAAGFPFEGRQIKLVGPEGIFKPAGWRLPLSILTAPEVPGRPRPYDDEIDENDLLRYRYRGTDPNHPDNVGLRDVMAQGTPLIYFDGVTTGQYYPAWPVFIVDDDPKSHFFVVAEAYQRQSATPSLVAEPQKAYAFRLTRQRLHQVGFRQRVVRAYRSTCAVCRLRRNELLDAGHILRDGDPRSRPIASHGLLLCKLHHAAFDANVVGISPDLVIELREDVLEEKDGPMLIHGLQGFQGSRLIIPTRRDEQPNREHIEERYSEFREAV